MAKTFAKLNDSNIVTQVTVVDDGNAASEAKGEAFLRTIFNDDTAVWKLSDDSTGSVGKGYVYDTVNKIFHEPQPFPSYTLNLATKNWEPPIPRPDTLGSWNEAEQKWEE
jgi:hypothetical protein|tara:strand:- start:1198 stop:1527 length:330 start_codon:yes stop_codon:yes gene_type:complete